MAFDFGSADHPQQNPRGRWPSVWRLLPSALREVVDHREFAALAVGDQAVIARLEDDLDVHLVPYHRRTLDPPPSLTLCQVLVPARLNDDALAMLYAVECSRKFVLVAYTRPVLLKTDTLPRRGRTECTNDVP